MTQESDNKKPVDKRRTKELPPTKVVVRRLPPSLTAETLLEQISPLPSYDFFYFMRADLSLGTNAFSRAYINFQNYDDIANFRDKFDGYIFIDGKGNEYPAIVEFSTFQKIPKKRSRKPDSKKGTIEQDSDYVKFLDSLTNPEAEEVMSLDTYLEQLEAKEREAKATKGGPKVTTPLIEYIKKRREEKRNSILRAREERKKRDQERKQIREDERRKRKEREVERHRQKERQRDREKDRVDERKKDGPVKLLKNTERDNDDDESKESATEKDGIDNKHNLDHDKSTDRDKDSVDKGNDKDNSKYKEDKSRLRFSKENREKVREQRGVKDRRDDRDRGRPSPAKADRPRSSRDEPRDRDDHRDDRRPDRLRPKSYRDDRERRLNRDQDYYRDERPRSGLPRREDRRYRDDYRDSNKNNNNSRGSPKSSGTSVSKSERPGIKYDARDRKPDRDSGRSDNADKGGKSVRLEGDVDKIGSVESGPSNDKEVSKPERERTKPESKSSAHDDNNTERTTTADGNQSASIERRKRKDRPERAIYDPRKAMERRQGAKKDGGSKEDHSPRDSVKEESLKDIPGEGSQKDSVKEGSQKDSVKEGSQKDSVKEGSQKDSVKEGSQKDSVKEGSERDSAKEGSQPIDEGTPV